jgi:hypothetical protein
VDLGEWYVTHERGELVADVLIQIAGLQMYLDSMPVADFRRVADGLIVQAAQHVLDGGLVGAQV